MTNFSGTFPYKLWDLINSSKNNGIQWSKDGKTIIIDKNLFQRKCLNTGNFKTNNFLSITKQLNVYGFVQQAHRFSTRQFLTYKHENFQQGCPELLRDFCRRVNSSKPATESSEVSPSQQKKLSYNKVDIVLQARVSKGIVQI